MAVTYEPLANTTLTGTTSTVTFSSISQDYTDLIIVFNGYGTGQWNMQLQFNSDTGSNYSGTRMRGTGSAAQSSRYTSETIITGPNISTSTTISPVIWNIMNYSNLTTYKTTLSRGGASDIEASAYVGLWRSTSAITAIKMSVGGGYSFASGSNFALYGIKAA